MAGVDRIERLSRVGALHCFISGPDQIVEVDMDYFWPEGKPPPSPRWSLEWFLLIVDVLHREHAGVEAMMIVDLPDSERFSRRAPSERSALDSPGSIYWPRTSTWGRRGCFPGEWQESRTICFLGATIRFRETT